MISLTRTQHNDPLRQEALSEVERYLARFPEESLPHLMAQVSRPGDLFARSNMDGHITTSALVLDRTQTHVLLIDHKAQKRWLQPGGHYESPGSLLDSAMREVAEETGVSDLVLHHALSGPTVPLDIDTHPIGARPEKGEGDHFHHDFIYLLMAESNADLTPQLEEVSGVRWLPVADMPSLGSARFARLRGKLQRIL